MNSLIKIFSLAALTLFLSCSNHQTKDQLTDGVYTGSSRAQYTSEPFVGTVTLEVEDHKIKKVDFQIVDTLNNEFFGADYEKHYPNNEEYQQQCRNDWQGVLNYPEKLLKTQNIDSVDAVSGATWSYNIFKASVNKALDK